jgi:T-complex protein 1 subunit eta
MLILGFKWFGVDMESESIADNLEMFVWEPALVKVNMISSASEAACLILSVDETVKNAQSAPPDAGMPGPRGRGRGGGRGRGR